MRAEAKPASHERYKQVYADVSFRQENPQRGAYASRLFLRICPGHDLRLQVPKLLHPFWSTNALSCNSFATASCVITIPTLAAYTAATITATASGRGDALLGAKERHAQHDGRGAVLVGIHGTEGLQHAVPPCAKGCLLVLDNREPAFVAFVGDVLQ